MSTTAKKVVPPPAALVVPDTTLVETIKLVLADHHQARESKERLMGTVARVLIAWAGAVVVIFGGWLSYQRPDLAGIATVLVAGGFAIAGVGVGQQLLKGGGGSGGSS